MGFLSWPFIGVGEKNTRIVDRNFKKEVKKFEKKLKSFRNNENSQAEAACMEKLGFLYFDQKLFDSAIEQWKNALRVYQEINDRRSMAESYSNIGTACRLQGEFHQAARFYNKALLLDQEFNKGEGELKSFHNLGGTWLDLGENENALEAYNSALEITREFNIGNWEALSLYRIGLSYLSSHQYRDAFRFFEDGLRVAEEERSLEVMTRCTFGMGTCYEMLGEYAQAVPCYQDSYGGAKTLEDPELESLICIAHAKLNIHLGFLDESRDITRTAKEAAERKSSQTVDTELHLLRARIYAIQGLWEKAFKMLEIAEENAMSLPNGQYLAQVLLQRANFDIECGHYENARTVIDQMNRKYPDGKSPLIDLETTLALGFIYRGLKKQEQTLEVRESAVLKAQFLACPRYLWRSHHSLGRFYHQLQRFEQARDQYETALKWIDRAANSLDPAIRSIFLHQKERLQVFQDYVILLLTTGHKEIAARTLKRLNSETLNRKVQHFFK